jgi:hypothetical protein
MAFIPSVLNPQKGTEQICVMCCYNAIKNVFMSVKPVQQILPPPPPHMVGDGFRVHNFFPSGYNIDVKRVSPFFLLDYNAKVEFPPRETPPGRGRTPAPWL